MANAPHGPPQAEHDAPVLQSRIPATVIVRYLVRKLMSPIRIHASPQNSTAVSWERGCKFSISKRYNYRLNCENIYPPKTEE